MTGYGCSCTLKRGGGGKVRTVIGAAALAKRRWWQGTDCYRCSCTGKRGDGSNVWVIMGVATLERLAVVPRYGLLMVQLHLDDCGDGKVGGR